MNQSSSVSNLECDVLVAGGGPAGLPAAIAAARQGAKVILCQDRPMLGGNASSEIRMHIVGADSSGKRGIPLETEAREGGIVEEIRLENCVRNPQRSPSMFDIILYEKCRAEKNLKLMLNTAVTGAEVENDKIVRALAECISSENSYRIKANVYVDCTGDGRLGFEAGAPFMEGRESQEQFGESLAPNQPDNKRLGSSLMFQAKKHDRPMPFTAPPWARHFSEEDLHLRSHATIPTKDEPKEKLDFGLEYGYWWIEWGGHLDTIKQGEEIRDELMGVVLGIWDHVKNGGEHGADNWALDWVGFVPGKRESRRFIGQHVLTQNDLVESRAFDDAIAYGGWPMDLHPVEGVDAPDAPPCVHHRVPYLYDVPLRVCVSNKIRNLMFAGRNLSATHVAFASTRVMATCSAVGEGVGIAAAYSVKHNITPSELSTTESAIRTIQQEIMDCDGYLIDQKNNDPCDLALTAAITASSEQTSGGATNIISGQTRAVHGAEGTVPERANPGTHRWMSDPEAGLPAWVELRWPTAIEASSVQLIFDTGLHRVMTLSHATAYTRLMKWGEPAMESVCDYSVEAQYQDQWRTITQVEGNYLRRNVIALDDQPMDAIRVTVTKTNGLDHARICEIRVLKK